MGVAFLMDSFFGGLYRLIRQARRKVDQAENSEIIALADIRRQCLSLIPKIHGFSM
jgi:hypothetical protein